jgi:C4-dicarboxylate transporter, DctM subunit
VTGLATGLLRIHEAAAFTALYVLVIELFVYKDLKVSDIPRIARKCVMLVGAILVILATAVGFTAYCIQAEVPQTILAGMETFISSPWTFLLILNVFLLVVGMLMDIFSAIIVVVPLIAPIAHHFGINPYHLATIFLLNLEIGYLTPPVGMNLFLSSFRFERPMTEVYRAVLPFIGVLIVSLLAVTYVPQLSTWSSQLVQPLSLDVARAEQPDSPEPSAPPGSATPHAEPPPSAPDKAAAVEVTPEDAPNERKEETLDDLLGDAGAP